ncbi:MAG: efflux RND transporter permease subunit [Armatimonadetes bacterium]|nr:efflux RND transporter permease subunit [Armatimonadota bacterium]
MFARIAEFSVRNRALIVLLWAIVAAIGLYAFTVLPIDAVPDLTPVQVQVNTVSPGLGPAEIEQLITFPIEAAMSGVPRVREVWSISKTGLSQVTVVFHDDVDIYFARQLILERLQQAREEVPEGVGEPELGPISTGLGQIYEFVVEGEGFAPRDLRAELQWNIKPQLMTVPGVVEVNSFGGFEKQYQVLVDPDRLRAFGITLSEVFEAVEDGSSNAGGAFIEHGSEQYLIRGVGLARSLEDLERIALAAEDGSPVQLHEVAELRVGDALRQGAVTMNGEGEVVAGMVMMLIGANSRTVVQAVKERLEEIKPTLPKGMRIRPYYDRTELVDATLHTVRRNLFEGGLLVIAVLFLLLGNLRSALIVALAIPLSMLVAATGMVKTGVTGNLMSLGAIDFGLIVDGAVVMAENVSRRLAHKPPEQPALPLIVGAVREVSRPVTFAVGIIIIVYLPILTLEGIEGRMFRPMALTVVYALAGSLLLALTLTPALCALLLRRGLRERTIIPFDRVESAYGRALEWALGRRLVVVGAALAAFLAAAATFTRLGSEFVPQLDEGAAAASVIKLPSISLAAAVDMHRIIERNVKRIPEVTDIVSRAGAAEIADDPMGPEEADVFIGLKPRKQWRKGLTKEELVAEIGEAIDAMPGANFSLSQPIQLRVNCLVSGVRSDLAVKVFGPDLEVLREQAERVGQVLAAVRGASEVQVEQVAGLPVLEIRARRNDLARYGVRVAQVHEIVETALGGKAAGEFIEGQRRWEVVVRLPEAFRDSPETIADLLVTAGDGAEIPLAQLCDIELVNGPAQIGREHNQRRVVVECNIRGRDMGGFVAEAQEAVAREVSLPAGYHLEWGGQFENLARARLRLMIVVPIALTLIFVLLYATFGRVRPALLIYCNVPFAVIGGVFALLLRGMPFSISAGVGFIALCGVAVLNGVVMVSYIDQLREGGRALLDAVREGARTRLRPVLMTALVASLGFIPMAASHGTGAEVQRPLATVVIGGLITSTVLTLLVLPTLYAWFEGRGDRGAQG